MLENLPMPSFQLSLLQSEIFVLIICIFCRSELRNSANKQNPSLSSSASTQPLTMTEMDTDNSGVGPVPALESDEKHWISKIIELPNVSSRVGHALLQYEGKILMIGGGSEEGEVKEVWELELDLNSDTVVTKLLDVPSFPGLYEFSANLFGDSVWIFGGSDQNSTKNDLYVFDLDKLVFQLCSVSSENTDDVPPPRTQFGNKCLVGMGFSPTSILKCIPNPNYSVFLS